MEGRAARSTGSRSRGTTAVALLAGVLLTAGCSVKPTPLSDSDRWQQWHVDQQAIFKEQPPITKPITIHEAMARAIKFNLDKRLKAMEHALAASQTQAGMMDLLPSLTASAGYSGRNNFSGTNSRSLDTGEQTQESSTSAERDSGTMDLRMSWNVLDFGVSYARAKQFADRDLIVRERQRKVIHNIIQDTRIAFWRAVAAQRLEELNPFMHRVRKALNNARISEEKRIDPPLKALKYRRDLLEIMRQLKRLRRDLVSARTQLAILMNLRPNQKYSLQIPSSSNYDFSKVPVNLKDLENRALLSRPELKEEDYQTRISALETRKEMLRMLPGIDLSGGFNYDDNRFVFENTWWDYSTRLSHNLMNIFTAPSKIAKAEARERVAQMQRLALSMAVLSQVHVAWARMHQSRDELVTTREVANVENSIFSLSQASHDTSSSGELDLIRAELRRILSRLRLDVAYGEYQNAIGRMQVSIGMDPLPAQVASHDLTVLAGAIEKTMSSWHRQDWRVPEVPANLTEKSKREDGRTFGVERSFWQNPMEKISDSFSGMARKVIDFEDEPK